MSFILRNPLITPLLLSTAASPPFFVPFIRPSVPNSDERPFQIPPNPFQSFSSFFPRPAAAAATVCPPPNHPLTPLDSLDSYSIHPPPPPPPSRCPLVAPYSLPLPVHPRFSNPICQPSSIPSAAAVLHGFVSSPPPAPRPRPRQQTNRRILCLLSSLSSHPRLNFTLF